MSAQEVLLMFWLILSMSFGARRWGRLTRESGPRWWPWLAGLAMVALVLPIDRAIVGLVGASAGTAPLGLVEESGVMIASCLVGLLLVEGLTRGVRDGRVRARRRQAIDASDCLPDVESFR